MPCIGNVPSIVATQTIDQPSGGNLAATTLFTPAAAGLFRVSVYITAAGNFGSSASYAVKWTDQNGAITNQAVGLGSQANSNKVWVLDSAASEPITIEVDSNSASFDYTIYVVVEQLA